MSGDTNIPEQWTRIFSALVLTAMIAVHLIRTPTIEDLPDFVWVTVILGGLLLPLRNALAVTICGSIIGNWLHVSNSIILPFQKQLLKSTATVICLVLTLCLLKKLRQNNSAIYVLTLSLCVGFIGIFATKLENPKIGFIYFVGSLIIAVLSFSHSRRLNYLPAKMLTAWLIPYGLWVMGVYCFKLAPMTQTSTLKFIEHYFLKPFPIFLLELLIASHIAVFVKQSFVSKESMNKIISS